MEKNYSCSRLPGRYQGTSGRKQALRDEAADLIHFGQMVQAPPGATDPTSSTYLFHSDSTATLGKTTPEQNATM